MTKPNDFQLCTMLDGELVSNFNLREFMNPEGWALIHPDAVKALEQTRRYLNTRHPKADIIIRITNTTRTPAQLNALAEKLGWIDEGGLVARNSKHLTHYGGIAVDFKAYSRNRKEELPNSEVGPVAQLYFGFVKYDYADNHIHGDTRNFK